MNDFPVPVGFWDLPTCPKVAYQITQLLPLGRETLPQLLDVVRWDPAISARILAAANGTRFGQHWPVVSLQRAHLLLDDLAFRLLSLQFNLDSLLPEKRPYQRLYETFWKRAHVRALATKLLCDGDAEEAEVNPFLASLLCDLERLALIQSHPEAAQAIYDVVLQTAVAYEEAERDHLPPELGESQTHLLFQANFPAALLKAVKSRRIVTEADHKLTTLAEIFDIAEALADFLTFPGENPTLADRWRDRLVERYAGFNEGRTLAPLEDLIENVRRQFSECFPDGMSEDSASAILQEANRELGRLSWETSVAFGQMHNRACDAEKALHEYEQKIRQLEQQALRDPLTGVHNRRFLLAALQKEVSRCCRHASPLGLVFVDVDHFKALNDTRGHLVGDVVLRKVAETLESVLRGADVLARYGGEEFVILPNDPTEKGIVLLAERLRTAVEQLVIKVNGDRLSITVSVGCTLTVPKQNELDLVPQLLASADAAMYDAKQLGRNRVVFRSMLDEAERQLMQRTIDCSFSRWIVQRSILRPEVMESVLMEYSPERLALGELAIEMGLLSESQVLKILDDQAEGGERFGTLALKFGWLTPEQLALLLARQRENPVQLARLLIAKNLLKESYALHLVQEFLDTSQVKTPAE